MTDIIRNYQRPDERLIAELGKMQTATLHEAMGKSGALSHDIKPIWPETSICGCALTVEARPADNLMLHKAVSIAKAGDVLVVNTSGYLEGGIWGEIITVAAMQRGITGLITDGAVRDTIPIKKLSFAVFCRGLSIKGTTKHNPGKINHTIELGGVIINPGDLIVGDNDGVVVVPLKRAAEILAAAIEKEEVEAKVMEEIRKGKSTMDILGFQAAFDRLQLKEESADG